MRDRILNFVSVLMFALLILGIAWAQRAKAHSWYDPDCCSGQDCAPVTDVKFVDRVSAGGLPVMVVTTMFGTKPLTPQTKMRESKDGQMHGCIYQEKLICLYLPPGQ